jgi:transcription termination factor NusB
MRSEAFMPLPQGISSIEELSDFFQDDIIFSYENGDIGYFVKIYSIIYENIAEIESKISDSLNLRNLNPFVMASIMCAIAEIDYAEVDQKTISSRYKEIIRTHSFDGSEKIIDLLSVD